MEDYAKPSAPPPKDQLEDRVMRLEQAGHQIEHMRRRAAGLSETPMPSEGTGFMNSILKNHPGLTMEVAVQMCEDFGF